MTVSTFTQDSVQRAPFRARLSWMLFDWAVQPYYTLILTFVFAPYFANTVVANGARGQALWGYAAAIAGILVAFGSPFLGAFADGRGRRKPWIALISVILPVAMATLWIATPNAPMSTVYLVLFAFVCATASAEFATVFSNAIMPGLVPPNELGRLSGSGWAFGYCGGLVSLVIVAGLLVANPETGKTVLGLEPLVHLDLDARVGDRIVGPFAAVWFLVFMIPFFLYVPDIHQPRPPDAKSTTAELWETIRSLPANRNMLKFLAARMIFTDGLTAIFTFGGIYGAAVFGWGALSLGIFGIILTVVGVFGAFIGGLLDDRLSSKTVILSALLMLLVGAIGILSVDKTHVLYIVEVVPKVAGSPPFSSTGEQVFLAFAIVVGLAAAPVQASSRSLLARLAPPEKITQFFGLFAFSGKVTAFLAPFLVATVTDVTDSQRLGMSAITLFLITGMIIMAFVRSPERRH